MIKFAHYSTAYVTCVQELVRELENNKQRDAQTFQRGNRTLLGEISKLNGRLKQIEGLEEQLNG